MKNLNLILHLQATKKA